MSRAKDFEKMLLIVFRDARVVNQNHNKSEWIKCPKERLLTYINQLAKVFAEVSDLGAETPVEKTPRKRKNFDGTTNETSPGIKQLKKAAKSDTKESTCCSITTLQSEKDDIYHEYVADIMEQDSTERQPKLNAKFLHAFIEVLTKAETSREHFPISLAFACRVIGIRKGNFQRIIDSELSRRKEKHTGFIEGIDFIRAPSQAIHPGGRPLKDLNLTVTCFKESMMQLLRFKGDQARRYFSLVEGLYRDSQNEELQASIRSHDAYSSTPPLVT